MSQPVQKCGNWATGGELSTVDLWAHGKSNGVICRGIAHGKLPTGRPGVEALAKIDSIGAEAHGV
jgi:hypothetical protein